MSNKTLPRAAPSGRVTLKVLAAELNLDPATVSVVLNNVPGRSIPETTRERIRSLAISKFDPVVVTALESAIADGRLRLTAALVEV